MAPNDFAKINYAIWAAVSTAEQAAGDRYSLENQVELSRRHALAKGWVETADPYIVPGESRTIYVDLSDAKKAIPQLEQLLTDARDGKFDVVVCYEYDRFRELLDPVARTLASYGVQLYSVSQPVEPQEPATFNPYASDAEFMMRGMSQMISRASIASLRRKYFSEMPKRIEVKGLHSGALPWGYRKPAGRETDSDAIPVQDPQIVPYLLMMRDMLLSGRSTYQIAAELERLGAPPPKTYLRRSDRPNWDATTVKRILTNPYYAGITRWKVSKTLTDPLSPKKVRRIMRPANQVIRAPGAHQPVWDEATLRAIEAEFDRRAPSHRGHITRQLTGLLHCSICGAMLWRHTQGSKKYKERKYISWRCSEGYATHMAFPNEMMLDKFAESLAQMLAAQQPEEPVRNDEAELLELDEKRRRIGDAFEAGLFDLPEFSRRVAAIDTRLAELKLTAHDTARKVADATERARVLGDLRGLMARIDFREYLRNGDFQEINTVLHQVVQKVIVFPDGSIEIIPK